MAGQSQAANLGGMLSQIGGALGSMGGAGDGLLGSIKNTFRPGVDPNDPESLRNASQYQMRVGNTDQATLYTKQAELMAEKQRAADAQRGQAAIAYYKNQMTNVLKDTMLSPEERQAKLNALQEGALTVASKVPGMDPSAVAGLAMQTENEVFAQQSARAQEERAAQAATLNMERFGLAKEEAARAAERHDEYMQTADYRQTMRQLELEGAQYTQAANDARTLKPEAFKAKYGDQFSTVYDAVQRKVEMEKIELANAQEAVREGKWEYTEADLKGLGLDQAAIDAATKMSSINPRRANALVLQAVKAKIDGEQRVVPPAAMVELFKDAAMQRAREQGGDSVKGKGIFGGGIDEDKVEQLAAQYALTAAEAYSKTGSFEDALRSITAESVKNTPDVNTMPKDPIPVSSVQEAEQLPSGTKFVLNGRVGTVK